MDSDDLLCVRKLTKSDVIRIGCKEGILLTKNIVKDYAAWFNLCSRCGVGLFYPDAPYEKVKVRYLK
jgi:hypothetical protein